GPAEGGSVVAQGRRILLSASQIRAGAGPTETYERLEQRIENEAGLRAASQVKIDFDPTFESVVLHFVTVRRGGESIDRLDLGTARLVEREPQLEAQLYDGRQSLVLFVADLRVGDVLDYAYSVIGSDPTLGGKLADMVFLGSGEPIARRHARVVMPPQRALHVSSGGPGGTQNPAVASANGQTTYTWDLRDCPAWPADGDLPTSYVPLPFVVVSEFASWN